MKRKTTKGSERSGPFLYLAVFQLLKKLLTPKQQNKTLLNLYNHYNSVYHNGNNESPLTDEQFDAIQSYLLSKDLITKTTGAPVVKFSKSENVKYKHLMPSMEFVRTLPDILRWQNKHKINEVLIMPKYDGISLQLRYNKGGLVFAGTRGDGITGKDVTRHALYVPNIPKRLNKPVDLEIRCEAYLFEQTFHSQFHIKANKQHKFVKARNAVSGTFGRNDPNKNVLKEIKISVFEYLSGPHKSFENKKKALEYLKSLGLPITEYATWNISEHTNLDQILAAARLKQDVLMDGLVVECNNLKQRRKIGFETNSIIPAYARAYKPLKEASETVVQSIGYSVSKDNYLKPVINIKPVVINGITISNINGHNAGNLRDNGIAPGAKITVSHRGDTIPHLEAVLKPAKWEMPIVFGELQWKVNEKGKEVDLIATKSSDDHKMRQILHFFEAVGVEYFNEGNVEKFYKHGFKRIIDILEASEYMMTAHVPGIKEKSAKRIRSEFDKLRSVGVTMPKLMYASGCFGRGFGEDKLDKIYSKYGDDIFNEWTKFSDKGKASFIATMKGFSHDSGMQFAKGLTKFNEFKFWINDLVKIKEINANGKLKGVVATFTEFRDPQLVDLIKINGGGYSDSLSKSTTVLLRKNNKIESKKTAEAVKRNISIMEIDEFKAKYKL